MPSADKLEWPQGEPLFETHWRAVSESLAGNGIVSAGDFQLSAGTANREVTWAAGTVFYVGSEYSAASGSTTVSIGDGTYDRWDTVYFDTGTSSVGVREGTPAANPEPPDLSGGEILLGVLYVPQNFDDVFTSGQILNWRALFSNEAEEVHYDDGTGTYGVSNVDAALDELQEAAQISAYPLAIGDLASPFALPSITDMDVAGTDLTDGATVLYESANGWFRNEAVQALANLTADEQLSAYPLALTDLASPFALQSITDGDLGTGDLTAESGAYKVFDNTADHVPRAQVDDHKAVTTVSSSTYTTSDEEVVLVDTATIGASSTITLASADCVAGNTIRIADLSGSARAYPITIDTEGTETIDGASSYTISTDYNAIVLVCDGNSNWKITASVSGSGRGPPQEDFSGAETGQVAASSQGVLVVSSLDPGEVAEVSRAVLTTDTVEAVSTGVDLELVTFDNAGGFTSQATLAAGDGATVYDDVTGSPVASYENTGTAAQSIGVIVDNTLTSAVDIVAITEGRTGL